MAFEESIHFVVTGAMTNLAILLKAFPRLLKKIATITIMGGAVGVGNWTPAAEFNIAIDPEAASIVFNCGIKVVMVPLHVTRTVQVREHFYEALKEFKSSFALKIHDLFKYFELKCKENRDLDYAVAHDPCTIYFLLHP